MEVTNERLEELQGLRFKSAIFIVFLILVIGTSIFIIQKSIIKPEELTKKVFDYKVNSSINYKVWLYPNNFFKEKYLGMSRQYATDLIEKIEVEFFSNVNVSTSAIIDYDYEIIADLIGTYSSDSSRKETQLWTNSFTLLERTKGTVSKEKNYKLKEKIDIDFPYYNKLVTDFKKELRLNIDASLYIKMNINYKMQIGDEIISASQVINMDFPLSKTAFVINTTAPKTVNETIYSTGELIIQFNFIIAAVIFLVVSLVLVVIFVNNMIKLNKKTEFTTNLNKILKNYGDVIAQSETAPNFKKYDVVEIINFDDLIDIENEVRIPIIYYEKKKDAEGWFTLIHGEQMYLYILFDQKKTYPPRKK